MAKDHLMYRALYLASLASTAYANPPRPVVVDDMRGAVDELNKRSVDADDLLKRSPDIAYMIDYWDKTDAIVEGYDAIVKAGEKYLPKFADETTSEYKDRSSLTKFTNIYRDIVEGLASKPFEEEITLIGDSIPAELEEFIEDVDGAGNNLSVFAALTFFNGINSAIDWIFVDYPIVNRDVVRTVADEKSAGIRPFWTHVLGRNMLEVRSKLINGKHTITYVRMLEPGISEEDKVRVIERNDVGNVVWTLYEKVSNSSTGKVSFVETDSGQLSINVIPLVPFSTGRRDGTSWKFFPAMQDAADLQIKLYQAESALEFISTMAGYPMLAANGIRPQYEEDGKTIKKVAVGPRRILYSAPDGNGNSGSWEYVEPSGASMDFLEKKITNTKQDLRELGRQPLTATSGNLTTITTAVAAGKAKSAVSAWALGLKDALENALKITALWKKNTYEAEVSVYTEFDDFAEGNKDLDALSTAREKGDLSQETYWSELKRRKVLSPEFDAEEERRRLLKEIPSDVDLENDDDADAKIDVDPNEPKPEQTRVPRTPENA